jgi:hypothetical protein
MKRILVALGAVAVVGVALAWSQSQPKASKGDLDFTLEKRNPVTHLKLNNDPNEFQFAIVSDRTGGHRPKVFSRAIEQINLLQPEFVVSVGDLVEGYTSDKQRIAREWREFQTYVSKLQTPFFYVPGNHDLANKVMLDAWKEKFGRTYYHFVYRDVLFVMLDSEDPPGNSPGHLSAEQLDWLKKTLDDNKKARWTLVFLHKPMWQLPKPDPTWDDVEKLLAGRNHTVFAGHVHTYRKAVRNGKNNYYSLATTGGDSRLRGVEQGEFDHVVWVTMKKDGPVMANVLLDGILKEDLSPFASDEQGVKEYYRRPTHPVEAKVLFAGKPAAGAYVALRGTGKEPRQPYADGFVAADGSLKLSTYEAFDGVPAGDYAVTVVMRKPFFTQEGKLGPNLYPEKYADTSTSGLTFTVKPGENKLEVILEK